MSIGIATPSLYYPRVTIRLNLWFLPNNAKVFISSGLAPKISLRPSLNKL